MPVGETPVCYRERTEGSASKLRTYYDGWRILRTILWLIKEERPLQSFSIASLLILLVGGALSIPVIREYFSTGMVPRFPTAILCMVLLLLSFIALVCGLILNSVALGRKEAKRMAYLSIPHFAAIKNNGLSGDSAQDVSGRRM